MSGTGTESLRSQQRIGRYDRGWRTTRSPRRIAFVPTRFALSSFSCDTLAHLLAQIDSSDISKDPQETTKMVAAVRLSHSLSQR